MKKRTSESLSKREDVDKNNYNWKEMIKHYKQAAESYLDSKKVREAAGEYKKLGYAYAQFAETVDTAAENIDQTRNAIDAYRKAATLYKQ
ncbi:MAG: hypothetical protein ACFFDD_05470, partial [Promethearchaeota archaeon]